MLVKPSALSLHKIADPKEGRYSLGAVALTRDRGGAPLSIATDGRRLAAFTWEEPPEDDFPAQLKNGRRQGPGERPILLPHTAAVKNSKARKGTRTKPILGFLGVSETEDDKVDIVTCDVDGASTTQTVRELDGRYPRIKDVVASVAAYGPENTKTVALDAKMLVELLQAITAHVKALDGVTSINLTIGDYKEPVLLSAEDESGNKAMAMLMPRANPDNRKDAPKPGWIPEL